IVSLAFLSDITRYPLSFPTRRSSDLRSEHVPPSPVHNPLKGPAVGNTPVNDVYHQLAENDGKLVPGHQSSANMRGSDLPDIGWRDRKSTRLNSSHVKISYAVFCLKNK